VKHFYRLILSARPGGPPRHEEWIVGTLDEVKDIVQQDLEAGFGACHAVVYGEDITLEGWQGAERVARVDLHPCVRLEVEGFGTFFFDEAGETLLDTAEDYDEARDDELEDLLLDEQVEFFAHVDWDAAALPALEGEPLAPEEEAELREAPYRMSYGHHDLSG
jgi:hypothetical protein